MEYSREQHQALRNIDTTLVYERFDLDNTGDKRIKNAVDVLVFVKGIPFSKAIPMLAEAFPEALEGPLPELSDPPKKKEKVVAAPAKENLTLIAQERFFSGVCCSKYDILVLPCENPLEIEKEKRHVQQFLGKNTEKILDHNSNII